MQLGDVPYLSWWRVSQESPTRSLSTSDCKGNRMCYLSLGLHRTFRRRQTWPIITGSPGIISLKLGWCKLQRTAPYWCRHNAEFSRVFQNIKLQDGLAHHTPDGLTGEEALKGQCKGRCRHGPPAQVGRGANHRHEDEAGRFCFASAFLEWSQERE